MKGLDCETGPFLCRYSCFVAEELFINFGAVSCIEPMGRILAIDYGRKRCGIAVTDPLHISANGLDTQPTHKLVEFLKDYCLANGVEMILVGQPLTLRGELSESMTYIKPFMKRLAGLFPDIPIVTVDERFTSAIAHRDMIAGGLKRSQRQSKPLADKTAAVIILNDWLQSRDYKEKFGSSNI